MSEGRICIYRGTCPEREIEVTASRSRMLTSGSVSKLMERWTEKKRFQ